MAHTRPITNDFWYDEEPGDEGPFPGYHTREPPPREAAEGLFDWVDWGKRFIENPVETLLGTFNDDYLPLVDAAGQIITYLNPEEGIVELDTDEELEEFVVIASEQSDPPVLEESGTRGWDWRYGWLDDAYDVGKYIWDRAWQPQGPDPPPALDTETSTGQTMPEQEMPTVGEENGELTTQPGFCAPGASRFSASKARSVLLKRAAWAIGQCNLKYSSFKWLVTHTGLSNTMRTLRLTERQVNFLLLNPVRRRGRGITAANIRTVNRTMGKLESLNRRLNCACGTKKSYRKKKASCR